MSLPSRIIASILSQSLRFWQRSYWSLRLGAAGAGSYVYPRARIYRPSMVRLGRNVVINDFVHIWGSGGIDIGDDTLIAAHCVLTSQTHDIDALQRGLLWRETNSHAPISIGRNVWLGSGVVVLSGIRIGQNSVVAAGAVVTADVPEGVLVAGVPARVIRSLTAAVPQG
jgi:acetyltransferase-like isoleucine patch superfamily enzyme